jgi:cathepsin L
MNRVTHVAWIAALTFAAAVVAPAEAAPKNPFDPLAALERAKKAEAIAAPDTKEAIARQRAEVKAEGHLYAVGATAVSKRKLASITGYAPGPKPTAEELEALNKKAQAARGAERQRLAKLQAKMPDLKPVWPVRTEGQLPESFDWSDRGVVSRVRDQGECGSCWAFATVSVLEANYRIKHGSFQDALKAAQKKAKPGAMAWEPMLQALNQFEKVDGSEQQLVSCVKRTSCKDGGDEMAALNWIQDNGGLASDKEFPYSASDALPCKPEVARRTRNPFDWSRPGQYKPLIEVIEYASVEPTVEKIKRALLEKGPLIVGMHATESFLNYTGGIFNANPKSRKPNHAMTLVGWDDSPKVPEIMGIKVPLKLPGVWIVRNSWGDEWGEDGYVRIPYDNGVGLGTWGGVTWVDTAAPY